MLQDALAASSITATVSSSSTSSSLSSSLLDCNLLGRKDVFHKVSNIVRQKKPQAQELDDNNANDLASTQAQNRVVELD